MINPWSYLATNGRWWLLRNRNNSRAGTDGVLCKQWLLYNRPRWTHPSPRMITGSLQRSGMQTFYRFSYFHGGNCFLMCCPLRLNLVVTSREYRWVNPRKTPRSQPEFQFRKQQGKNSSCQTFNTRVRWFPRKVTTISWCFFMRGLDLVEQAVENCKYLLHHVQNGNSYPCLVPGKDGIINFVKSTQICRILTSHPGFITWLNE